MKTPARPVLCGLLFILGGMPSGLAQSSGTRDQSADACPATLANVRQSCGCEPREEAVFNSLAQTKLNSGNLRSRVTDCFKLDGNLNVDRFKVKGDAALTGCLSKVEDQFPEYRQTLAELVAATKNVSSRKLDIWLDCYGRALGQGSAPSNNPTKRSHATRARPSMAAPTTAARVERSSTEAAPTAASHPYIDQSIEADGSGSVTTEGMEAVHDSRSGSGTIRQKIKASDRGVITTGPINARIGH
ncbi:hypothetical protein [Archangium violaceum]|uniref:hypothetical protein n=1 Tax=Archangium violaceum TaxID=83451 RepID=UPI0036DAD023